VAVGAYEGWATVEPAIDVMMDTEALDKEEADADAYPDPGTVAVPFEALLEVTMLNPEEAVPVTKEAVPEAEEAVPETEEAETEEAIPEAAADEVAELEGVGVEVGFIDEEEEEVGLSLLNCDTIQEVASSV
jgi:hypothetical protein